MEGPDYLQDDVVRVIDDIAEVHRLQKDGRGWDDDMALVSMTSVCVCVFQFCGGNSTVGLSLSLP